VSSEEAQRMGKAKFSLANIYLFLYNIIQFLGWSYILGFSLIHISESLRSGQSFDIPSKALYVFQGAALLEILHSLVGLVNAPLFVTTVQVFSRIVLLIAIYFFPPLIRSQWILHWMVVCWSITEVIRYLFFSFEMLSIKLYPLLWLRYSTFLILYPAGVAGEIGSLLSVLPFVGNTEYYLIMAFVPLAYLPGLPKMYGHMLAQRRKKLNEKEKSV